MFVVLVAVSTANTRALLRKPTLQALGLDLVGLHGLKLNLAGQMMVCAGIRNWIHYFSKHFSKHLHA